MKAKVIIVAVLAIVIIAVWAMNTHLHKGFKSDPTVEFTQILSDISYWPGKRITTSKNIEGKRWYYQTYQLTSPENYINLVVSNTAGKQTVDITGLRSDSYLCITGTQDGGKYLVEDLAAETETGIENIENPQCSTSKESQANSENEVAMFNAQFIYDLSGRIINSSLSTPPSSLTKKGIFIKNGKKNFFKDKR